LCGAIYTSMSDKLAKRFEYPSEYKYAHWKQAT
jgi:hypothetical protein